MNVDQQGVGSMAASPVTSKLFSHVPTLVMERHFNCLDSSLTWRWV